MKPALMALLGCSLVSFLSDSPDDNELKRADTLEKKTIDSRRAIRQINVVFKSRFFRKGHQSPNQERTTTIWMDGTRIREDRLVRADPNSAFHREIRCRNCEIENHWLFYTEQKFAHPIALSLVEMNRDPIYIESYAVIDPRLLGIILETSPNLAASRSTLESILRRPDRRNIAVHEKQWQGKDCFQIDYELLNKSKWRLVIVPDFGYSITYAEAESHDPAGIQVKGKFETELQYIESAGLWYPKKFTYLSEIAGKREIEEITDVEVVSLNKPLPAEVFKLSSMDIRPGTPIASALAGNRPKKPIQWDGKEIVGVEAVQPIPQAGSWQDIWWFSSVALAFLAAFLVWRVWRTSRKTK